VFVLTEVFGSFSFCLCVVFSVWTLMCVSGNGKRELSLCLEQVCVYL